MSSYVPLCHAIDDAEVVFLKALLDSHEIYFFIVGEHFGSLFPGIQIGSYNERRFLVLKEDYERAKEVVELHRKKYEPVFVKTTNKSKLRVIVELLVFWWCLPGGKKKNENND